MFCKNRSHHALIQHLSLCFCEWQHKNQRSQSRRSPPPPPTSCLPAHYVFLLDEQRTDRPQRTPTGKTNRSYLRVISRYICRLCVPLTDLFIDRRGGDLLGLRASRWRAVNVSTRFSVFCGPWCSKFRQDAYLFNYLFFPRRILQSSVGEQRSTKRTN